MPAGHAFVTGQYRYVAEAKQCSAVPGPAFSFNGITVFPVVRVYILSVTANYGRTYACGHAVTL